jgi:hypothetical protein
MIEENVVATAGTVFKISADDIERAVRSAGFIPRRRNMRYELQGSPSQSHEAGGDGDHLATTSCDYRGILV